MQVRFNERETVGRTLERVGELPGEMQVVVVDDGSTDGTAEVLAEWVREKREKGAGQEGRSECQDGSWPTAAIRAADAEVLRHDEDRGAALLASKQWHGEYGGTEVEVWRHDRNRGKGAAIRTGLARARGAYVVIQDADQEYDPRDIPKLLEPLLAGTADVMYGSRYLQRENDLSGRLLLNGGVRLLNLAVRMLYGVRLTDEATCYKMFPTSLLRAMDLQCERFEFCPEVTAKACRLGVRLVEVPIRYHGRSARQGKKLRLRDGLQALAALWRWRKWCGVWDRELSLALSTLEPRLPNIPGPHTPCGNSITATPKAPRE